ncbi:hypothetical protein M422DRAFT_249537 [Sphaerobolus stellatus SS14]|uniref:Uncharacterized protein n=1 Tax=Sphaerobolus stellatus (strain SS14) TaxID=990650 RepID=A0A0C9W3U5_SPHS4|nr:hypothetical protein M422DRAFT_249537 [Sphaerobolus stellatus SS14]
MKCEYLDKTAWAVKEGAENITETVREMCKLERCRTASLLEKSWYDLDICAFNLEQMVDRDLMEADGKVLALLDMKSRGVEVPPGLEKRIMANRGSIVASYTTHMEHIFLRMNTIKKRTAWTRMTCQSHHLVLVSRKQVPVTARKNLGIRGRLKKMRTAQREVKRRNGKKW